MVLPVAGQVYQYNPYTGRATSAPVTYNPYVGGGTARTTPNPLTGTVVQSPAVNPFTGKTYPSGGVHNPLTGSFTPATQPPVTPQAPATFPVTGKAAPTLEALDDAVKMIMDRHGIPGGALAIAKNGKLVYAKGFGWADLAAALNVDPQTMFSLASLSKPITAMAVLLLIERGKLSLEDRPFVILQNIPPPRGARVDPRLYKVTVRQMLNHTGGWDRQTRGDPINWSPQISRALGVPMPITETQFISFMEAIPLDFEPGTKMQYSNVGYIVLGQLVEKVSGQSYYSFVSENILKPAGMRHAFVDLGQTQYRPGEAHSYMAGNNIPLPPMNLPMVKAAGGWRVSAVDMVRFLTALDGSRTGPLLKPATFQQMLAPPPPPLKPRPNGSYNGLGWPAVIVSGNTFSYAHEGQFPGARTFMKRSAKGLNWALLFNVSMDLDPVDVSVISETVQELRRHVEDLHEYPDVDFFKDFQ
jgi:N-acyl-D-amino-acid deacylase